MQSKYSFDIKGLDLKTDKAVQDLCESSNASSGTTRSVIYILVIISVLALAAVLNSYSYNWSKVRINFYLGRVIEMEKKLDALEQCAGKDPANVHCRIEAKVYRDSLEYFKTFLASRIKNQVDNYQTLKMPILGNATDINDLGLIAGISFTIILIISRATISREINNLQIALHAITERYPDEANAAEFDEYVSDELKHNPQLTAKDILACINYTRREHHYNYLTMNEIFTFPPLKTGDEIDLPRLKSIAAGIFWIPYPVYLLMFINDFATLQRGLEVAPFNTCLLFLIYIFFLIAIPLLASLIKKQKTKMHHLYKDFKHHNYKYETGTKKAFNFNQIFVENLYVARRKGVLKFIKYIDPL